MIGFIKGKLSRENKHMLKRKLDSLKGFFFIRNLTKLAILHKTDKFGSHFYTQHYQKHFKPLQFKKLNLFEIGVGGYENPYSGGNSLRMWRSYFPFSKIYSLDIYDKSYQQEKRIKIFKGSQIDNILLNLICEEINDIDIIIDDGSHINEHVITSFKILFPKLKKGGIYVIEDTQTSYWEHYGGSSKDLKNKETICNYFKSLVDSLNHEEFIINNYEKSYFDKHIISMHFYHNLIFIYKGDNDELSNMVMNNKFK